MYRAALLLPVLLLALAAMAEQPYWLCRDAGGARVVQDVPCREAPDAPPSGVATSPMTVPALVPASDADAAGSTTARDGEVDALGWWERQWARVWAVIGDVDRWRDWLSRPVVWAVAGGVAGLLLLRAIWRRAWPAWQQRRIQRQGERQPDPYRHAMRERVRSARVLPTADAAPPPLQRPSSWSMQAIRGLPAEPFEALCTQLWRWQGLRVERDLRTPAAVCLSLRRTSEPERLHGLVWCQAAESVEAAALRELFGLMHHYQCTRGVVMTSGDFDAGARDFARGKPIELKGALTLATEIEALTDGQRRNLLDAVYGLAPSAAA